MLQEQSDHRTVPVLLVGSVSGVPHSHSIMVGLTARPGLNKLVLDYVLVFLEHKLLATTLRLYQNSHTERDNKIN